MKKNLFLTFFFLIPAVLMTGCGGGSAGDAGSSAGTSLPLASAKDSTIKATQAVQLVAAGGAGGSKSAPLSSMNKVSVNLTDAEMAVLRVLKRQSNIRNISNSVTKSTGYTESRQNNDFTFRNWDEDSTEPYNITYVAKFFNASDVQVNPDTQSFTYSKMTFSGYSTAGGVRFNFSNGLLEFRGNSSVLDVSISCQVSATGGIGFTMSSQNLKLDIWKSLFVNGQIEVSGSDADSEITVTSNFNASGMTDVSVKENAIVRETDTNITLNRDVTLGNLTFNSASAELTHPYMGDMVSDTKRVFTGNFNYGGTGFEISLSLTKSSYLRRVCGINVRTVWMGAGLPSGATFTWADYFAQDTNGDIWYMGNSDDEGDHLPASCTELSKELPVTFSLNDNWVTKSYETQETNLVTITGVNETFNYGGGSFPEALKIRVQDSTSITDTHWNKQYGIVASEYSMNDGGVSLTGTLIRKVPQTPANVSAAAGNSQAMISWSTVSGATEYLIYYRDSSGINISDTTYSTISGGIGNSKIITGLTNGTTYYFRVQSINADGASVLSAEVQATP